jgi:aldose 1-epimerase
MNDNSVCSLVAGDLRAMFWPGSGMLGVSLRHRGVELLRRIDDLESAKRKGRTAGIPVLYPWANRLSSLSYRAAGREVTLDPSSRLLHFDDQGLPMHGVPWGQLAWEIVETKRDLLLASLDWNRPDLLDIFPFPHKLEIAAAVTPDSLTLCTNVVADARSPVPITFGFHPYFGFPQLPRSEWHIRLPRMQKLNLDPRGIPAGAQEPFGPLDALLGDGSFDDGFAVLDAQPAFTLSDAERTITVTSLEGFPYVQVFAPKDKDFIALEPMTAPTSALTSGNDLRVVEPGAEFRASFRIAIHTDA